MKQRRSKAEAQFEFGTAISSDEGMVPKLTRRKQSKATQNISFALAFRVRTLSRRSNGSGEQPSRNMRMHSFS